VQFFDMRNRTQRIIIQLFDLKQIRRGIWRLFALFEHLYVSDSVKQCHQLRILHIWLLSTAAWKSRF